MLMLMCYAEDQRFAIPIDQVVEVVGRPVFDPIPSSPSWLAGSFVHRGVVTPVIDFSSLTQLGSARSLWSSRVIVIQWPHDSRYRQVGLLFDRAEAVQVSGNGRTARDTEPVQIWSWGPTMIDEFGTFCRVDMDRVLSPERQAQVFPVSAP
jgi:chemotaxis-related protein WspB